MMIKFDLLVKGGPVDQKSKDTSSRGTSTSRGHDTFKVSN